MEPLLTAAEMRELDRRTISDLGVPSLSLMESAGRAVAAEVERMAPSRVVVVAGPGNNGGDGVIAARTLHARGHDVRVLLLGDKSALRGDPKVCFDAATKQGVIVVDNMGPAQLREALVDNSVVIDALYGTGLSRPLEGQGAAVVKAMNDCGAPIVAVDIPSGLDPDRGVPLGVAVFATTTVTFAFAKRGLYGSPGFVHAGKVVRADIGIPRVFAKDVHTHLIDDDMLAPFAGRSPLGHKGTHGHVLIVAGSVGKIGAALLAGRAALRAGAGLCTLASPIFAQARIEGRIPELMTFGYPGIDGPGADGAHVGLDVATVVASLKTELNGKRVIAIGPGVPTAPAFAEVIERVIYAAIAEGLHIVLDADGLNHLAHRPSLLAGRPGAGSVVMTPHPGEAARLLGSNVAAIEADRFGSALALAKRFDAVVALKGARTVIAAPDGRIALCAAGGPILGVGGTGDVLTGAVSALLASRVAPAFESAAAAVQLHARTADILAEGGAASGMFAGELADALPLTLARARQRRAE